MALCSETWLERPGSRPAPIGGLWGSSSRLRALPARRRAPQLGSAAAKGRHCSTAFGSHICSRSSGLALRVSAIASRCPRARARPPCCSSTSARALDAHRSASSCELADCWRRSAADAARHARPRTRPRSPTAWGSSWRVASCSGTAAELLALGGRVVASSPREPATSIARPARRPYEVVLARGSAYSTTALTGESASPSIPGGRACATDSADSAVNHIRARCGRSWRWEPSPRPRGTPDGGDTPPRGAACPGGVRVGGRVLQGDATSSYAGLAHCSTCRPSLPWRCLAPRVTSGAFLLGDLELLKLDVLRFEPRSLLFAALVNGTPTPLGSR